MGPVKIDKSRTFVYKTNKYSVPSQYRFKSIYYRIARGKLNIYSDDSATRLIRQHSVAPPDVKNQTFIHDDDMKIPSKKWKSVKQTLLNRYSCPSMSHFLNGVCVENPNYREPQLSAILTFLEEKNPCLQFLEEVLSFCCATFSYKMSQFETIYLGMEKERGFQSNLFEEISLGDLNLIEMPNGVKVQVRPSDAYQGIFERKVQETAGGVK